MEDMVTFAAVRQTMDSEWPKDALCNNVMPIVWNSV